MYRYIRYFVCLLLLGGLPVSAAEVNPEIIQAIALEGKVSAIIHLQVQFDLEPTEQSRQTRSIKSTEPEIELTTAEKLERISQAIAPVQAEILAAVGHLDASQFNLTLQYSHIAALVADIGAEALAILRQHPNVLAIQVNSLGSVSLDNAKPVIKVTDNATDKNRIVTQTGAGITVAVLDTGIDTNHDDFKRNDTSIIVGQKCYVNKESKCANGTSEDDSAKDDNGHGTHVSGIIASPNGVAPDSKIVAVKIADNGGGFQLADLMAGVNWVMSGLNNNNVKIMNLSLGLSDSFDDAQACDFFHPSYTTTFGQLSNEFKVSIFAASGNDNDEEKIDWPSCLSNVIAVGNSNNSDALHTGEGSGGNRGALLKIVAPGVNITASKKGGGTEERTGTSMSSPMAAGVAALLLQKTPGLSPSLIKQKLISTGAVVSTNYRRIDATEALKALPGTTTQAIMQVTHNFIPLFNDKTYDFGIFSPDAEVKRDFKIHNLGNDSLNITNFSVEDDTKLILSGASPNGNITAGSARAFGLKLATDTGEGSFSKYFTFKQNDTNFKTTLKWHVCNDFLPFEKNFAEPKGCWKREIVENPNDHFLIDVSSSLDNQKKLISYDFQQDKHSLLFNSSNVAYAGGASSAKARFTSPRFSTVGNKDVGITFDWYERVKTSTDGSNQDDNDKVTVQWSTDGLNWDYLDEFKCQTDTIAGWKDKTLELPATAEGQPAVYVSFLFEADNVGDKNADEDGIGDDCLLADLEIVATTTPAIAIYGNGIKIPNPSSNPNAANGTNFGEAITREFVIVNNGQADLTLTSVSIVGADAGYFTLTRPDENTIIPKSEQKFSITFNPAENRLYNATVQIESDAHQDEDYFFVIQAGTAPVKEEEKAESREDSQKEPFYLPPPLPDYVAVFVGSPNGRVVSEPEGIDCDRGNGTCWAIFPRINPKTGSTTRMTLHPIAPEGLRFAGWSGDADCKNGVFYLNNIKRCLAHFYGYSVSKKTGQPHLDNVNFTTLIADAQLLSQLNLASNTTLLITADGINTDPSLTLIQPKTQTQWTNTHWQQAINRTSLDEYLPLNTATNTAAVLSYFAAGEYHLTTTTLPAGVINVKLKNPTAQNSGLNHIASQLWLNGEQQVGFELKEVAEKQTVLIKVWAVDADVDPYFNLYVGADWLAGNDYWHQAEHEIPKDKQPLSMQDAALLLNLAEGAYIVEVGSINGISGHVVVEIQLIEN